jgi:hypothetical protein
MCIKPNIDCTMKTLTDLLVPPKEGEFEEFAWKGDENLTKQTAEDLHQFFHSNTQRVIRMDENTIMFPYSSRKVIRERYSELTARFYILAGDFEYCVDSASALEATPVMDGLVHLFRAPKVFIGFEERCGDEEASLHPVPLSSLKGMIENNDQLRVLEILRLVVTGEQVRSILSSEHRNYSLHVSRCTVIDDSLALEAPMPRYRGPTGLVLEAVTIHDTVTCQHLAEKMVLIPDLTLLGGSIFLHFELFTKALQELKTRRSRQDEKRGVEHLDMDGGSSSLWIFDLIQALLGYIRLKSLSLRWCGRDGRVQDSLLPLFQNDVSCQLQSIVLLKCVEGWNGVSVRHLSRALEVAMRLNAARLRARYYGDDEAQFLYMMTNWSHYLDGLNMLVRSNPEFAIRTIKKYGESPAPTALSPCFPMCEY